MQCACSSLYCTVQLLMIVLSMPSFVFMFLLKMSLFFGHIWSLQCNVYNAHKIMQLYESRPTSCTSWAAGGIAVFLTSQMTKKRYKKKSPARGTLMRAPTPTNSSKNAWARAMFFTPTRSDSTVDWIVRKQPAAFHTTNHNQYRDTTTK